MRLEFGNMARVGKKFQVGLAHCEAKVSEGSPTGPEKGNYETIWIRETLRARRNCNILIVKTRGYEASEIAQHCYQARWPQVDPQETV